MVEPVGQHASIACPVVDARWPDRLCLSLAFDPIRLAGDLARLEGRAWTAHFVPQHYEGDWSVLPLRAPVGATHPILQIAPNPLCRDWEDTALLGSCPYIQAVLSAFACPIEAVRLMRLAPGSIIKEHRDFDLAAEQGVARLHIPIATNPDVDFRLNGTRVAMAPGSVWYLRLADPHSVTNAGETARVHLVIDAIVDPWLEDLLDRTISGCLPVAPDGRPIAQWTAMAPGSMSKDANGLQRRGEACRRYAASCTPYRG